MPEPTADKTCSNCVCSGIGPDLSRAVRQALNVPEAASEHFKNASVEVLKGLRELLDHRIEKLSRPEAARGTKLAVD